MHMFFSLASLPHHKMVYMCDLRMMADAEQKYNQNKKKKSKKKLPVSFFFIFISFLFLLVTNSSFFFSFECTLFSWTVWIAGSRCVCLCAGGVWVRQSRQEKAKSDGATGISRKGENEKWEKKNFYDDKVLYSIIYYPSEIACVNLVRSVAFIRFPNEPVDRPYVPMYLRDMHVPMCCVSVSDWLCLCAGHIKMAAR